MATIKNLKAFNEWIEDQKKRVIPEQHLLFQKRIALEVFRRVIMMSPVGNPELWKNPSSAPPGYVGGRFRGNWQISIYLNETETGRTDQSGGETVTAGVSATSSIKQPYRVIWIFNNVPYAMRLEQGHSTQAPAGIVSVTLASIQAGTLR